MSVCCAPTVDVASLTNTNKVSDLHKGLSNECVSGMGVGCKQAGPDGRTVDEDFKTGVAWV